MLQPSMSAAGKTSVRVVYTAEYHNAAFPVAKSGAQPASAML